MGRGWGPWGGLDFTQDSWRSLVINIISHSLIRFIGQPTGEYSEEANQHEAHVHEHHDGETAHHEAGDGDGGGAQGGGVLL